MNPSHTWFCHNSIQSPFNSSTYLDYSSKKNAGMWWQRARIIFLFPPTGVLVVMYRKGGNMEECFLLCCSDYIDVKRSSDTSGSETTFIAQLDSWHHTHNHTHTHMGMHNQSNTSCRAKPVGVTAKRGGMTNGEDDSDYSLLLLFFNQ